MIKVPLLQLNDDFTILIKLYGKSLDIILKLNCILHFYRSSINEGGNKNNNKRSSWFGPWNRFPAPHKHLRAERSSDE